jgi:hypothetical protein
LQPLTRSMRRMFRIEGAFVAAIGTPLTLLPSRTDAYFAWTIASPQMAAFLGAAYVAAAVLEFRAARERLWANARGGAWLIGLGFAVLHAIREGDIRRVRPAMEAIAAFCLLQFAALSRFAGDVLSSRPSAWIFVAVLALLLAVSTYGSASGRRIVRRESPAGGAG